MRTLILATALFIGIQSLQSQPLPFDVINIPAVLKNNAASVKREESIVFDVRSSNKAFYKIHSVVTVLNEKGRDELNFQEYTDQFHSLDDVRIELMDARGKQIGLYNKKDLNKIANLEELVPDGKVYYLSIPVPALPVTIRMDYEVKFEGTLNYPSYLIQKPGQSVQQASFTVKIPNETQLRYQLHKTALSPAIREDGKSKWYHFEVADLPSIAHESGSVSGLNQYSSILIAPGSFELDGYKGDMSSWKNFGSWYNALTKDALDLSNERKLYFQSLVKQEQNDRDKARLIYQYLQNNFRYVSIQLGIGGWKPFQASFTDKKKYGDCKALSTYTQACLAAVGIKSYQALINAGYNSAPVDPGFSYNGFNHMILCVPMDKDTVWLECTSTTNEFAELGNFTENRNALLITEDGGKLVPTPRSMPGKNLLSARSSVFLNEDGSGTAKVVLQAKGEYKQEFIHYLAGQKPDVQKKYLLETLGFIHPDKLTTRQPDKQPGLATLEMEIEKIPAFTAGSKIFLHPRIHQIWNRPLPKAAERTQDYYFEFPLVKTDTTIYQLPEGYVIETLPKAKKIIFEQGIFTTDYVYDAANKIVSSTARLELKEYKITLAKFVAAKQFINDVMAEYMEKIVIKKL